eukprot:scaffold10222_cov135-Isochrysis_galbana.AAC.5
MLLRQREEGQRLLVVLSLVNGDTERAPAHGVGSGKEVGEHLSMAVQKRLDTTASGWHEQGDGCA